MCALVSAAILVLIATGRGRSRHSDLSRDRKLAKENTDSFWGPSVHWNTHLEAYVVLMNRSCCTTGFPQEGIYAAFNSDLSKPTGWTKPKKILGDVGWYPQVLGLGAGETDSVAGKEARLYVNGQSRWKVTFRKPRPSASESSAATY